MKYRRSPDPGTCYLTRPPQRGCAGVIAEVNDETGPNATEELDGTFVHTDVTDPDSVRNMVEMVMDEHGRVDVLVNNAGIVHNIPSEEVPDEEWLSVISVNGSRR